MYLDFIASLEENNIKLNVFLRQKGVSGAHIKRMKFIDNGILVNGVKQNTDYKLKNQDKVSLLLVDNNREEKTNIIPQDIPLDIVYQDDYCMVVDKPFDMPVHPSLNHPQDTLANAFCGYFQKQGINKTCRIINRLDRNTSGLVLIAKDSLTAENFKGDVEKIYTAIVQGRVEPSEGILEFNIDREDNSIITRCVKETGQYAKTGYTVVKQNDKYSVVDTVLYTGRTHQVRVHFSHIGHTLVGDDLYGATDMSINRHALHCSKLTFTKPYTKQRITINSNLPNDMQEIADKI